MSCNIIRNENNEITNVLTKYGKESKLFKSIARHPLIDDALPVYKNIYSNKLKDVNEADMELVHQVGGTQYDSFKNALKDAQENTPISVGILVGGKFTELVSIPKTTEPTTELGFIQSGILNNLIAEEKVRVGNSYELQGYGNTELRQLSSIEDIKSSLSFDVIQDGTTFKIVKKQPFATLYTKSGEAVNEDVSNMSDDEIRSRFVSADELIARNLYLRNFPEKRDTPPLEQMPLQIKGNEELVKNLVSLLKNMGVSVVSMTNYITNYNLRHGVNPNAEALADVANQVVAITAGQETVENLLEETVHFIVEALPQEKIENVLRNIDKSEEYKQNYQIQKAIYESEYSGEELENVVRREILGKIIVNAIKQTEEVSETQQNFFENAKRFISEFFQNIVNYFKPQYLQDLDTIIFDVQNLIKSQDVSNLELDNFEGNIGRFYNANQEPIIKEAQKIIASSLKLERDLAKNGKSNALNAKELRRAQTELEKGINIQAVAIVNGIADNNIEMLESALEDSLIKGKSYDLSQEENQVFLNLIEGVAPGLAVIKERIDSNTLNTTQDKILSENLTKTLAKIDNLKAKRTIQHTGTLEKLARSVTTDRGLPESDFNNVMAWTLRAESDVNLAKKTFGTMTNSSDFLANIYATLKTNQSTEANQKHHQQTKALQAELRKNGFDEKYITKMMKDGYFESELNLAQFEKDINNEFIKAYKSEVKDNILKDEEILSKRQRNSLPWTEEQREKIENTFDLAKTPLLETRMEESYYKELEKKQEFIDISANTKSFLQALGSQRSRIMSRVKDANGVADLSKLSKQEITTLIQLQETRKLKKSVVDETGDIRKGIIVFKNEEGKVQVELAENTTKEQLDDDARTALDLYNLDNYKTDAQILQEKIDKTNGFKRSKKFDDLILSKPSKEEAILALQLNSSIVFTDNFWEGTENKSSLIDRLKTVDQTDDVKELIKKLEDLNVRKTALLKIYTKFNNPSETDVQAMPETVRQTIKEIEQETEDLRATAQKLTKNIEVEEFESEGVSGTNESWSDLLVDNEIEVKILNAGRENALQELLTIAKKNATKRNADSITDAESNVRQFVNGSSTRVSKSVENSLARQGMAKEDLMDNDKRIQFLKTYAEDRLLSYFRRYTPQSYVDFKEDLDNDNVTIAKILSKDYEYLQITPNYSFDEEADSKANLNYIVNSKMGILQPNKSKYTNKDFEKFGTVVRDDKGMYVSATKNISEFNAYKAVMNYRFSQLNAMDAGDNYNYYITPQVRKADAQRVFGKKTVGTQSVKDFWENLTTYTEDDQMYGDDTFGASSKIIPKQYFAKLQSQSDVSPDVFGSMVMTNIVGNLYQSKIKYYGEIMALNDVARTRETGGSNLDTVATNRYKMLESAIENDQFGIRRTSHDKVMGADLGKVVDGLGKYLRFKGLGINPIIPATAYLTGKTKQIVERIVGEYVNKDSWKRGNKAYSSTIKGAFGEVGKVYTTGRLNTEGEFWGAFDSKNRLEETNLNNTARLLSKTAMIAYQAASYPIYAKGMLNVLHDYRIVNGKVLKFTDFKRMEQTKEYKISLKEIQDKWNAENTVIYDMYSTNEFGEVIWDKAKLKTLLKDKDGAQYTDEALDNKITDFSNDIRVQIKNLNVRFDLQLSPEDKVAAHRNYLWSFLMSFKGYTIPLFEERFKPMKMNDQSRQLEVGSYSGIFQLGQDIFKEWQKNGNQFIEAFKKEYNGDYSAQEKRINELKAIPNRTVEQDLEIKTLNDEIVRIIETKELRQSVMKRFGIDLLAINSLIVLVLMLRSYADDDKDKSNYALQLSYLMSSRLTSEVNSANLNIGSAYYDIIGNPLSAFKIITDVGKLPSAYQKGELGSTMAKNYLPFVNSMGQLQDPAKAADNIRYYSEVKASAFWHSPIYSLMTKEK